MFIVLFIIILIILLLISFSFILILKDDTNNDTDNEYQLNKGKFNKQLKWLKKAFNGERKDGRQLFFINKNDVTDVKLTYELLSAKEAVETNNVTEDYDSISFDLQDKYGRYQITPYNNLKAYDNIDENLTLYEESQIKKLHEKFMKESNFDEEDLVAYYKAIIAAKKINKDEVKSIAETYFKMVDQLDRLKTVSRNETVNEVIDKVYITQGFDQSHLRKELDELTRN